MPSQSKPKEWSEDSGLADEGTRLRKALSANLAEGLALSEFASTFPGREGMSDPEVLEAFRAAQREGEHGD